MLIAVHVQQRECWPSTIHKQLESILEALFPLEAVYRGGKESPRRLDRGLREMADDCLQIIKLTTHVTSIPRLEAAVDALRADNAGSSTSNVSAVISTYAKTPQRLRSKARTNADTDDDFGSQPGTSKAEEDLHRNGGGRDDSIDADRIPLSDED